MTDEPLRHWERDTDDRCPVCFVPPGAWPPSADCPLIPPIMAGAAVTVHVSC